MNAVGSTENKLASKQPKRNTSNTALERVHAITSALDLREQVLIDTSARRTQQDAMRRLASLFDPQDRAANPHRLPEPVYQLYAAVCHDFHN